MASPIDFDDSNHPPTNNTSEGDILTTSYEGNDYNGKCTANPSKRTVLTCVRFRADFSQPPEAPHCSKRNTQSHHNLAHWRREVIARPDGHSNSHSKYRQKHEKLPD